MREWTDWEVYNILYAIDEGYQPNEEEQKMLSSRKVLNLYRKPITALPESFGQLSSLQILDLRFTLITALPESFEQLSNLQILYLFSTPISALPETFGHLRNLSHLDLSGTSLTELPESFGQLSCLKELNIRNTKITDLSESFGQLQHLQHLDLSGTLITKLPEAFGQLSRLKELFIRNTNIISLPESFGQLIDLRRLDLGFTSIASLPTSIGNLSKLKSLHLWEAPISSLPESFGQLTCLQRLYLYGTGLSALPESVCQLSSLQRLDLNSTKITELPDTFEHSSNLQYLDLSCTAITRLPTSLSRCLSLRYLDLGNTKLTKLPEVIGQLPNLQYLDLRELTLPEIPESLAKRGLPFVEAEGDFERGINLYGTTLTGQDKTVFLEHPELISSLYEDQITLRESRVIFLGDGGVGKSYTIRRLQNDCKKETEENPYVTKETPGVEIADYRAARGEDTLTLHLWDFGGQTILHSMHRCFLTDQTCYVVTVRTRETDVTPRARYWLRNVTAFAPSSPILLYVNCWENADGKRAIDETRLRKEFPNIEAVVYCSAKEAEDGAFRAEFLDRLVGMVASSESSQRTVNRRWNAVRNAITAESETEHYLTKKRYRGLCEENGIEDGSAPGLLSFFNTLGVCFSYHLDEDRNELEDYKLLNPVWLTNAIYAIIEEGMDYAHEGRIKVRAIERMLGTKASRRVMPEIVYTPEQCRYVLEVAAAHNLCYKVDGGNVFFPALCSNNTPDEALTPPADYPQHVEYLLKYEYLPDSVVHQLMVRCLKADLAVNHCWLKGMMLGSMAAHKAIVRMDDDENLRIELWSRPEHPAYEMFELLRWEILDINKQLNLKAKEFILDDEDRYSLISLIEAERDGENVRGESGRKRRPAELLGRFYEDGTWKFSRVEKNNIIIPILPREYHARRKDDPNLRKALYSVYNGICPYCEKPIDAFGDMQVDHIFPAHYVELPELSDYVKYLEARGFDTSKPDYVENYFPVHSHCNREKSDTVLLYVLLKRHERAYSMTPAVLRKYETYKD